MYKVSSKKDMLSLIPALAMMVIIFLFSAKTAVESNGSSSLIANQVLTTIEHVSDAIDINNRNVVLERINYIIRKTAHMTEYGVLAILLGFHFLTVRVTKKQFFILNISICILYAMSDEFHQLFVDGRSGQVSDVLIDSIGIIIGTSLLFLFTRKRFFRIK